MIQVRMKYISDKQEENCCAQQEVHDTILFSPRGIETAYSSRLRVLAIANVLLRERICSEDSILSGRR